MILGLIMIIIADIITPDIALHTLYIKWILSRILWNRCNFHTCFPDKKIEAQEKVQKWTQEGTAGASMVKVWCEPEKLVPLSDVCGSCPAQYLEFYLAYAVYTEVELRLDSQDRASAKW